MKLEEISKGMRIAAAAMMRFSRAIADNDIDWIVEEGSTNETRTGTDADEDSREP